MNAKPSTSAQALPARQPSSRARKLFVFSLTQLVVMAWIGTQVQAAPAAASGGYAAAASAQPVQMAYAQTAR